MGKNKDFVFTSESVTEGHPDKIADRISDAVLDYILEKDKDARVACEVMVTTGVVYVTGEITTSAYVDIPSIVRETLRDIGYVNAEYGIDADTCGVIVSIDEQSSEIGAGVDESLETRGEEDTLIGAGDQGLMFGYATTETEEKMPLPIVLAHKLTKQLTKVRRHLESQGNYTLRPDGKSQITVAYRNGKPHHVDTVVISAQHDEWVSKEGLELLIKNDVIKKVIDKELLTEDTKYFINPSGSFVVGGPHGDVGLTGRKIIVDTYGGWSRHGGGAFSGKEPTKVDRSATYAARYVAKNIVAAGVDKEYEVQLSYAIGVAYPTSIFVDTFGTGKVKEEELSEMIYEVFKLDPQGIIDMLDLRKPIFKETSSYGHFGRNEFTWEQEDKVEEIREYFRLSKVV